MADLMEKLVEVLGSQELADKVSPILGEYMIPKTEHRKALDKNKAFESELEKIKTANMTNEERIVVKEKELNDKIKGFSVKENAIEVERILASGGLSREDYGSLLETIVNEDKDISMKRANDFVGTIKKARDITEKTTKEALLKQTKSPETGDPTTPNLPRKIPTVI